MKILVVILIINFTLKCKGDCIFSRPNLINSPIFVQKMGSEYLIIPTDQPNIKLGEFNEITAICSSGFLNLRFKSNSGNQIYNPETGIYEYEFLKYVGDSTSMILKCIDGQVKIKHENDFKDFENLDCQNSAKSQIYEISYSQTCDKKHYNVGLNIEGRPIVFADICFDLDNMRLSFIHYVAKSTTPVISHQTNQILDLSIKAEAPADSFFIDESTINTLIKTTIGDQAEFVTFKYEELYPSDILNPFISAPLDSAKNLNRFLGWNSFIRGNWKSFRNLLKSRSKKVNYDVYLGTSDVIVVPTNDECKTLKKFNLEEFSKVVSVPKYVWAYLKSNINKTDEFVVIGVNSPYFEFFPKNETIICNDICDEIDWFTPMEKFRKMSTFGYMFCCRKDEVEKKLDGFPVFNENKMKSIYGIPLFMTSTSKYRHQNMEQSNEDNKYNEESDEELLE